MIEGIGDIKILKKDPTATHLKKIETTLCAIRKEVEMTNKFYFQLYPSDAIPPRAYGMCKAHKPSKQYPFRVLVSTIGTAPYNLSRYLVKVIQPTLAKNEMMIKNSSTFVEEAKEWNIGADEIQVSYDVVALYPSIPVEKAIKNLMDMLKRDEDDFKTRTIFKLKHIKLMMEACLYKSYFLWDEKIHGLKDSGPIGLSLMVILAESFLQMIETKALTIAKNLPVPVNPITHRRYVDDSHDRFNTKTHSQQFLAILNDQEPRVQYTAEYEDEFKRLNYLDIKVINSGNGKYDFNIHRKEAITNVQIKPESCHDEKVKTDVFKGYIYRANKICSKKYLEEEINFIKDVFIQNGYEENKLDKLIEDMRKKTNTQKNDSDTKKYTSLPWIPGLSGQLKKCFKKANCVVSFKSPRNLNSILTSRNKPQLPPHSHPGCYFIPTGCKSGYTGETKKRICKRNTEHEKAIFNGDAKGDALAQHSQTCNCEIKWDNVKTLCVEPVWFRRKVREALEIRRLGTGPGKPNGLNRDDGDYVTTNSWTSVFDKINSKEHLTIGTFEAMTANI